jgi:tRNA threonylcarbamoyl adenosine modification protein YjeE
MELSSITTKSSRATIASAKKFLEKALKEAREDAPLIFYLEGELGAGKTHFVKGLAEALGIKDNITSPTFVLMKKYAVSGSAAARQAGKKLFFHIDCYRIYNEEDARQIGLDKILENPRSIVAVEWAERIADIVPKPYWKLVFKHIDDKTRKIVIKNVQR